MKELGLAIEKLTKEVAAKKSAVENEVTETQAAQIQLDRAAEDFRQLHEERQQLIKQWDEAIEAMKRRDEAVQVHAMFQWLTDIANWYFDI
jgi:Rad3-related DNA helicase